MLVAENKNTYKSSNYHRDLNTFIGGFSDNNIIVTIPFNRINDVGDKVGDKLNSALLNFSQIKVLAEIRNNPNITTSQLMVKCNLGKTSIDNIIKILTIKVISKESGRRKPAIGMS